jgi:hypothetical protein
MKRRPNAVTFFGLASTVALLGACEKSAPETAGSDLGTSVQALLFIKRQTAA